MRKYVWSGVLSSIFLYYAVPFLGMQIANWGVYRRGSGSKPEVALTFDDGPDPQTTPLIMDILEKNGVRGTFFMLGEAMLKHPDLARSVLERGHEVALHGFRHRSAFFRFPWDVFLDMYRGHNAFSSVFGKAPVWFRPAHGAYTAAVWYGLRKLNAKAVHWTIESHDWCFAAQDVRNRVLDHLEPGDVVVMHDSGPGAKTCVEALPELVQEMKNRHYQLKTLGQMHNLRTSSPRDIVQRIWQLFEKRWDRHYQVDYLTQDARSLFRLCLTALPDVPELESLSGTECAELHLHSPRMVPLAEEAPMTTIRCVRHSMKDLAWALENLPKYADVPGVFALATYQNILETLGFSIYDPPKTLSTRWLRWYMFFLRNLYSSGPNRDAILPKIAWMSRETLLKRYGR